MKSSLVEFSINRPWSVIAITVIVTLFFAYQFPQMTIDTDPENMLAADEPARLFHSLTKEEFALHDFIAVGVVVEPTAFTADMLNRIYRITAEISELDGVISDDIMAPSTVDDIRQGDGGLLIIEPLMADEITSDNEADHIFYRIIENPLLRGKLASDDSKAIALFIPIESKDVSSRIARQIRIITDKHGGGALFHIAGLPLAEDSFGSEMFVQMAYGAPASLLVIFLLLFMFFRNFRIVSAPMAVAMMSVIWAMGLLILTGNTVHIMSSMIPIFLMPVAVLDSVHILSEFHDHYKKDRNKADSLRHTISDLFTPMLFTTMTTFVGFISLSFTPIPPVRVFGIFVAFGILVAWLLSMTLIPAFITLMSDSSLKNFGVGDDSKGLLSKAMRGLRDFSFKRRRFILVSSVFIIIVAGYGLTLIVVNDNPVKWFRSSHPIRIADDIMNEHLSGTYMNYLVFDAHADDSIKSPINMRYIESMQRELESNEYVGAAIGVTDIIKKVRYELFGADSSKMVLPESREEIAQMLFLYEISGGDPDDLFKMISSDYAQANVWVQLNNGDNMSVSSVVEQAERYMQANPPPEGMTVAWAGLPYINIEWQNQMVTGMRNSLVGSFAVVLIIMIILFRSIAWGFVSLLPLSLTIMAIYAAIGYAGKPYDMPVAVLSSLTLGLSIDFAIHFIQRLRTIHARTGNFAESHREIFEGTSRAIARNVLVIALGFIPMLFSTLMPYITVGAFFLAIMIVSGLVTLVLLPAIISSFRNILLPEGVRE